MKRRNFLKNAVASGILCGSIESLAGECPSQPDTLPIRPKAKNLERYIALIVRYKDYRLFMGESVPERIIELANEAKRGGQKIDYIEITPNLAKHCIDFDFVDLKVVCYMVEREPAMDYCEVVIWVKE